MISVGTVVSKLMYGHEAIGLMNKPQLNVDG